MALSPVPTSGRRGRRRNAGVLAAVLAVGASLAVPAAHADVDPAPDVDASTALASTTSAPSSAVGATPLALTWEDDFEGPSGAAPDPARWNHEIGGHGWGNNELQYYTADRRNSALDGQGNLVITSTREGTDGLSCHYGPCQFTSARLTTQDKFSQRYGRFEARIQVPRGNGVWPAFWMLGDNFPETPWPHSGEIDIMEVVGREGGTAHGTIHGPGYSAGEGITGSYTLPGGQQFADGFHVFAVDWSPDGMVWSVDGHVYHQVTRSDVGNNPWVFDQDFFMILNSAVGGNWPGPPDDSTQFPQRMLIDYVRVYEGSGTPPPGDGTGTIRGIGELCLDVAGGNASDGTPVQIAHCNGSDAQQWTREGDTIRALGYCLAVAGGDPSAGTPVRIAHCDGSDAQRWRVESGDIVSVLANRCLGTEHGRWDDGTPTLIWHCTGAVDQKWYPYW
ncbi:MULTISPECIES: family 16 glycosylhydrolase [Actinoalloteichus]|uniref:Ricin-type beta-trefoil lectin domain-containing protein n=1 Tax=Actinoalloteichus caeruleus DSM 43889 TaxID=1120930 RepID=A0ABT1JNB4_ACTCY|nr:family 16 glycosylhydrolase [Actinoalloteichus caeruleus]MCP2334011.1 Ricin-type beta-trefoil lectin domain-containing protein [Actinoalloteichus caeruleus DSM 43889]